MSKAQQQTPLHSTKLDPPALIFSADSPMRAVDEQLDRAAPADCVVLINGERGTGKQLAARLLHERSNRADRPFVPIDCAAIPEALLESELFGHAPGALAGATTARAGRVSLVKGGTLFLEAVEDLPRALQPRLLRLLDERRYEPAGSDQTFGADFRLVVATGKELSTEVEAGRYCPALHGRLSGKVIDLPPLRARQCDLPLLFEHFWRARGETRSIAREVLEALQRHPWPGNVGELELLADRLAFRGSSDRLELEDLPLSLRGVTRLPPPVAAAPQKPRSARSFPVDLPALVRELEESYITAALDEAQGNKALAARLLGLQRTTLAERLRRRRQEQRLKV